MAKRRTPSTSEPLTDDRILAAEELLERIPLDRSTIWRLVDAGKFPAAAPDHRRSHWLAPEFGPAMDR